MKKVTKIFMAMLLVFSTFAQTKAQNETLKDFKQPPKKTEQVIGIITDKCYGGQEYDYYDWDSRTKSYDFSKHTDTRTNYTEEQLLEKLMKKAEEKYKETYPKFALRNFKSERESSYMGGNGAYRNQRSYTYKYSASVVVTDPKEEANEKLSSAIDKALRNVREGSRIAIDQVTVWSGINRDDYKDQLIDVLLDKGYKVVAKDYLEKLYEEQQKQQSGIYNDRTTVQENNFSAVGYFINVKVTETSLRVQVVNVSTGEYEGNATVNF